MGFVAYQMKKKDDRERLRATLKEMAYVPWSLRSVLVHFARTSTHAHTHFPDLGLTSSRSFSVPCTFEKE